MTTLSAVVNPSTRTVVYIKPPYETHPAFEVSAAKVELEYAVGKFQEALTALWELHLDPSELVSPNGWPDWSREAFKQEGQDG